MLLCITGPDGSGKSTLISRLKAELQNSAEISVWDNMNNPEAKQYLTFRSIPDVDHYLSTLHPVSRSLFLFHCYFEALELAKKKKKEILLADGYWFKYCASEIAHGAVEKHILCFTKVFPEPDLIFYLRTRPDVSGKRKEYLSGYECGFKGENNMENFIEFQEKLNDALLRILAPKNVTYLDGELPVEENFQRILKKLKVMRSKIW